MQQTMEKIESLVRKYETELSKKGLICSVSKKYFETNVPDPSRYTYTLLDNILNHFARKRENKHFKHQRNRHHCAVLCFYPSDKSLLKKADCKEYSFMLSEISRTEEGYAPKSKIHKEEKVLQKIEKLLVKILKLTDKKGVVPVCKSTRSDFFRYFFKSEYGYKKTILGIKRNFIELIIYATFIVIFLILSVIIYL